MVDYYNLHMGKLEKGDVVLVNTHRFIEWEKKMGGLPLPISPQEIVASVEGVTKHYAKLGTFVHVRWFDTNIVMTIPRRFVIGALRIGEPIPQPKRFFKYVWQNLRIGWQDALASVVFAGEWAANERFWQDVKTSNIEMDIRNFQHQNFILQQTSNWQPIHSEEGELRDEI